METLIKHTILIVFSLGFILYLKTHKTQTVKEESVIIIYPNYNNNGMNKADSG
ncbi:MAG: hypothetical protein QG594_326 [Bacteroidota bacterium]|nr:hypothetical protein [Bacteroidota bacterium]